ncbi:MAG: hypothetical protein IK076_05330, partial [Bacteroidales bacterium]|nr:hypothetical protein [Bacteroidales bacterium]
VINFFKKTHDDEMSVGPCFGVNINRLCYYYSNPSTGKDEYSVEIYFNGDVRYSWPAERRSIRYNRDGSVIDGHMEDSLFSPYEEKDYYNFGIMFCADGNFYVGALNREGKKDGIGALYFGDGELIQQGVWSNDEFAEAKDVSDYLNFNLENIVKTNKTIRKSNNRVTLSPSFVLVF